MSGPSKSKTDWERVKRQSANAAPIPYDPSDGPYDPNDAKAVDKFFAAATRRRPGQRGPTKRQRNRK
jgi:hypothetical protein